MIEVSLVHEGRFWVARGDSWTARGETLRDLDRAVAGTIRQRVDPEFAGRVTVRMNFDRSVIPEWIRQYSQHYFNRLVTIDIPPEENRQPTFAGREPCRRT